VALGALAELVDRAGFFRMSLSKSWARLTGLPRSAFSTALAHFGIGVTVIGIVAASAWQVESVTTMREGETVEISGIALRFDSVSQLAGQNYAAERGTFVAQRPGWGDRALHPERRVYLASGMPTTEAAIETYGFSQLYLQLGEASPDGAHVVRIWYKPWITLVWLGAVVMAGAGFLSLTDRRLRIGVGRRAVAVPAAAE
jgi:cytochrome c-type biogenesis protein CcmF